MRPCSIFILPFLLHTAICTSLTTAQDVTDSLQRWNTLLQSISEKAAHFNPKNVDHKTTFICERLTTITEQTSFLAKISLPDYTRTGTGLFDRQQLTDILNEYSNLSRTERALFKQLTKIGKDGNFRRAEYAKTGMRRTILKYREARYDLLTAFQALSPKWRSGTGEDYGDDIDGGDGGGDDIEEEDLKYVQSLSGSTEAFLEDCDLLVEALADEKR